LLKELEIFLEIGVGLFRSTLLLCLSIQDLLYFLIARFDTTNDFLTLEFLEGEDLVELTFELLDEGGFVIVGPRFALTVLAIDIGSLQSIFEAVVINVVPVVVFDERLTELLAKPAELVSS
jgi:hypothetical protein